MKLSNIRGFQTIDEYVRWKLERFEKDEKTFSRLFVHMFSEEGNVMAELSDGYRIQKLTYGDFKKKTLKRASALAALLALPQNSLVGIYMDNSPDWIAIFWSVLICGYRPLLMNKRLPREVLESILTEYTVPAVISDGELFSCRTLLVSDIGEGDSEAGTDEPFGDEVLFMSSGTTQNVKLCAYTAENFYYQLGNSVDIIHNCPEISEHYHGELKLLTLLPFYHVFGFIAVYLWFCFFSRTLVFLKDMNPQTIQNTVKKHEVTHIFAVPMVWEAVYKATLRAVQKKGDKTYRRFLKAVKLSNKGTVFRKLTRKGLGEVREKLFGDSIRFLISGGGYIAAETLAFYNGIGYHIANGYGMTEVGITSVDIAYRSKDRNLGSVGRPFRYTEYKINEKGQLLIRGRNMASHIYVGGEELLPDLDAWFNSRDLARVTDKGYFLMGRSDDLIISNSGENLNPQIIESKIKLPLAEAFCLFAAAGEPVLLISSKHCYSQSKTQRLIADAKAAVTALSLESEIRRIVITPAPLMTKEEFKISRKKLAQRYLAGEFVLIDEVSLQEKVEKLLDGVAAEVRACFAEVLQKEESAIDPNAHFFTTLGGSSIDYFLLANAISDRFGADIKQTDGRSLYTVNEICSFIKEH